MQTEMRPTSKQPGAVDNPLLSIRDLHIEYATDGDPVKAVDGVSFDIAPGVVFGLAGESGSGKSTVAHGILRLLQPPAVITGGKVNFKGHDIFALTDKQLAQFRWSEISMVMQSAMNALNPVMTVCDQIVDAIRSHDAKRSRSSCVGRAK